MTKDQKAFEIARSYATKPLFYQAPYREKEPKQYQHAAVEYALRRPNAIIGDAPGVGKTAECIMISNAIEAKRTLVVCPASLRLNWEREIWLWSNIEGVTCYPVLKGTDGVSVTSNYVVISYNLLQNRTILLALCAKTWDHMIFDEAHKVKDFKGNITTKIVGGNLAPLAGRITFASGTLLPNQPNECYNAMRILDWESIDKASQDTFMRTYYEKGGGMVRGPHINKNGVSVNGLHWSNDVLNQPIHLDDLRDRLRSRLMIRRLKEDVMAELPPKRWHLFPLALSPAMKRVMKHPGWKEAQRLYDLDKNAFERGIPVDGAIATARRELGESKAPAVAEYIEELLLEGTDKVVVGAWHKTVLAYLKERLGKYGLVYMDGSTSATKKQKAVDSFQKDKSIRIILGQKIPLGEGWTLTASSDVVDAEPDWTPGKNEQLLDRTHRLGQTGDCVTGHVPVVPDTLDEKIVSTSVQKAQNVHVALDNDG